MQALEWQGKTSNDSFVRLAHAVQLTADSGTSETGLGQLEEYLGSELTSAAMKALQQSTRATHSVTHVGIQPLLVEICGSCQAQVGMSQNEGRVKSLDNDLI